FFIVPLRMADASARIPLWFPKRAMVSGGVMLRFRSRALAGATFAVFVASACIGSPASAQSGPSAEAVRVDRLAQNVERAESVHQVKRLQETYAQYSQFGLWDEMAALFAADAELIRGEGTVTGQDAIGEYFLETFGD